MEEKNRNNEDPGNTLYSTYSVRYMGQTPERDELHVDLMDSGSTVANAVFQSNSSSATSWGALSG